MKDRLRKARRIVAVQEQVHRQAEWRLADIHRQKVENERLRDELITTLNGDTFGPLLVEVVAKRLKAVAAESQRIAAEQERQDARVREEALRLKRAERMKENVNRDVERHQEQLMVAGILEGVAARLALRKEEDGTASGDASLT
ncbi:hypothetical protein GCM10007301_04080 [Azorhizobium oxalatiphilum]|uniref:Flagellar FliJ protein n=1 Tax=Azorhizobium oxalatiphilum TaxID=980631 RepID=A0A917BNM7_9HYPH|nr:hypothetical protein [Azorhizobium oxalatiphilum]GGF47954.1 hypothetical protein GCM10007301_04080 [Azorhizobium oxalatiphilum]